jgi:hypothetical protein
MRATACSTSTPTSAWTAAPAIFYEDDVPAQWKDFTATNAAFFTEGDDPLGSPGGFSKIGPQVRDTEYVANYTPTE